MRNSSSKTLEASPSGPLVETPSARAILELARSGSDDALERIQRLEPGDVATALQSLNPGERFEILELSDRVDEIVPLLGEVGFSVTLRGAGIEEGGWLVEFASPEQRVAAIDLDCWQDGRFSRSRFFQWVDAMIDAGGETLAASLIELDAEIWSIGMRAMGEFSIAGLGVDADGGEGATLDGVVFYDAFTEESESRIREILIAAQHHAPSEYWRIVYGALPGSDAEGLAWADRWQQNRLADLGFPERERAIYIYRPLRAGEVEWPSHGRPSAPQRVAREFESHESAMQSTSQSVAQALRELPPARCDEVMGAILGVANALTVADQLSLTDSETPNRSFEKAMRGIERGLLEIVTVHGCLASTALGGILASEIFRVGVTLEPELHSEAKTFDAQDGRQEEDWNVATEVFSEDELD